MVDLLLKPGAIDGDKNTPIYYAASNGHTTPVETMDKDRNTLLHLAAWNGHTSSMGLLLTGGASTEAKDTYRNTPLHGAAQRGHQPWSCFLHKVP